MTMNEETITGLVKKVIEELIMEKGPKREDLSGLVDTVDEEVENAVEAQKRLIEMSLERRCHITRNSQIYEFDR